MTFWASHPLPWLQPTPRFYLQPRAVSWALYLHMELPNCPSASWRTPRHPEPNVSQNELLYFLLLNSLIQWLTPPSNWVTQAKHLLFPFPLNGLAWFPFLVSLISIYFSRPLILVSDPQGGLGYCGRPPTFIHSHLPLPLHLFPTIIHPSLVSKAISNQLSPV